MSTRIVTAQSIADGQSFFSASQPFALDIVVEAQSNTANTVNLMTVPQVSLLLSNDSGKTFVVVDTKRFKSGYGSSFQCFRMSDYVKLFSPSSYFQNGVATPYGITAKNFAPPWTTYQLLFAGNTGGPVTVNATYDGGGSVTSSGIVTIADASTINYNGALGTTQAVTLGGNRTLTFSGVTAGNTYRLLITQDGTGSRTLTPSGVTITWPGGGSQPALQTAAGATDTLVLLAVTATTFEGFLPSAAAGSGSVTTVSVAAANGFAGTVATPTTSPVITLTTSITGILVGNGTAIAAATNISQGTGAQLNLSAISQPGTQVVGDIWYDSAQLGHCVYDSAGVTGQLPRLLASNPARIVITAAASTSILSGTVSLAAGALNKAGRFLRVVFHGYVTTAASGQGSVSFSAKLGSNVVGTAQTGTLAASATNASFQGTAEVKCAATGSSGKIESCGYIQQQVAGIFNMNLAFVNGTVAGTAAPTVQPTLDLTAAYAFDFQMTMSAAVNTVTITNCSVELWG